MSYHSDRVHQDTFAQVTEPTDDGGKIVTAVKYREWGFAAGGDGNYATSDDDAQRYVRMVTDQDGRVRSKDYCLDFGPDKKWFTADDTLIPMVSYSKAGTKETWMITGSMTDVWSTAFDDIVNPPSLNALFSNSSFPQRSGGITLPRGKLAYRRGLASDYFQSGYAYPGYTSFRISRTATTDGFELRSSVAAGLDGKWNTADDTIDRLWKVVKAGSNYVILEYAEAGIDNIWATADDLFLYGVSLEFNAAGDIVREKHVVAAGADQNLFTDDDIYAAYIERTALTAGAETRITVRTRWQGDAGYYAEITGVPLAYLAGDITAVYVIDSGFLKSVWSGPKEITVATKYGTVFSIDHQFIVPKSAEAASDVDQLIFYSNYSTSCVPTDPLTLAPCVAPGDPANSIMIGTQTIRRNTSDSLLVDNQSPSYTNDANEISVHRIFETRRR